MSCGGRTKTAEVDKTKLLSHLETLERNSQKGRNGLLQSRKNLAAPTIGERSIAPPYNSRIERRRITSLHRKPWRKAQYRQYCSVRADSRGEMSAFDRLRTPAFGD